MTENWQNSANIPASGPDSNVLSREALDRGWENVKHRMRDDLGETVWRCWIRNLVMIGRDANRIRLGAETRLVRNRVASQYADRLRAHFKREWPEIDTVDVEIVRAAETMAPSRTGPDSPARASERNVTPTPAAATDDFGSRLDPRMTFDNFIVGNPNQLAYAAALRTAESDKPQFNPLFLHGGVGLGKTHLMHAIAWHIRARDSNRRVVYLSAEAFMHRFIKALRHQNTMQFKEQFRSVDVLMVDDVQFIGGKDSTQEEFFHTFNALIDQNKQIIISADKSPTDLSGMEERLRSRLNWGMVADIHPTTFELRLGIIEQKAEQDNIHLSPAVIEFLAHKITSNVRELEGALNRIAAYSTLIDQPVTIETVREVLADVLRASNRQVSIGEIKREVARHYNIRLDEMHSRRRSRNIVRPRQVAMYLSKTLTSNSYPEIGQHFGGRDHTTVMHAVSRVEEMLSDDPLLAEDMIMLRSLLNASG